MGSRSINQLIQRKLASTGAFDIRFSTLVTDVSLTDDRVLLTAERGGKEETFEGRFVIAADGAQSQLRKALEADFSGKTYPKSSVTAVIDFPFDRLMLGLLNINYVWTNDDSYSLMHLRDKWRCAYAPRGESLCHDVISKEQVKTKLLSFFPQAKGLEVVTVSHYAIHQRVMESFVHGRVIFARDSAHLNSPSGGMGMNSGIHDARCLIEHLAKVWSGADLRVLERYPAKRKAVAVEEIQRLSDANYVRHREVDAGERKHIWQSYLEMERDENRMREFLLASSLIESLRRESEIAQCLYQEFIGTKTETKVEKAMDKNTTLKDLYKPLHDERARRAFVGALKIEVNGHLEQKLEELYETRLLPEFKKTMGRAPNNRAEAIPIFEAEPLYQVWGSLCCRSQDLLWETVGETIDRLRPEFEARARSILQSRKRLGTVELNPDLDIPKPIADVEIHRQPGGYFFEGSKEDLTAAMLYMGALELYRVAKGLGSVASPGTPARGQRIIQFIEDTFGKVAPKRILDLGCANGTETIAYKQHWPDAEVHGVDLSGPFVRFAHIWAEDNGLELHFHQMNAAEMSFPDGHFDLILPHILFQETWFDIQDSIMAEIKRLLAPGGHFVNIDVPYQPDAITIPKQVTNAWQVENNGEPYWTGFADRNVKADLEAAGFARENIFASYEPLGQAITYFFGATQS